MENKRELKPHSLDFILILAIVISKNVCPNDPNFVPKPCTVLSKKGLQQKRF